MNTILKREDPMASLRSKLKTVDPEIIQFVQSMENENLKLQKQRGNLQAQNVTLSNQIKMLKDKMDKYCVLDEIPYECLQKAEKEIDAKIKDIENESK